MSPKIFPPNLTLRDGWTSNILGSIQVRPLNCTPADARCALPPVKMELIHVKKRWTYLATYLFPVIPWWTAHGLVFRHDRDHFVGRYPEHVICFHGASGWTEKEQDDGSDTRSHWITGTRNAKIAHVHVSQHPDGERYPLNAKLRQLASKICRYFHDVLKIPRTYFTTQSQINTQALHKTSTQTMGRLRMVAKNFWSRLRSLC